MKKNYTLLGLLFFTIVSFGQAPTTLWEFNLPAIIEDSSPAIGDDGTIYIGCNGKEGLSNVYAIKPDGTEKWKYETGDIVRSAPAISSDGNVYIGSYDNNLYGFNQTTGAVELQFDMGNNAKYSGPVFATDGTIYIGSQTDELIAVKPDNTMKWRYDMGGDVNGTPAIGNDGTIYIGSTGDDFFAINPNGTLKWQTTFGAWTATATAIGPDGTVYFAGEGNSDMPTDGGVLIAFNPADGTEKWRVGLTSKINQGGPAVAANGTVYAGGADNELVAYNPVNGAVLWSYATNGAIQGTPAIDNDGNIYVTDVAGYLYVVDSAGSEEYTPVQLGVKIWSSPTIGSDGRIYVVADQADDTGKLYALTTTATSLQTGGWPMRSKDAKHTGNVNPITLSTNKESLIGFNVYPNPVNNGEFYITTTLNRDKSVQIFDMLGKQVYSKNIEANEIIRTSNLKSGVYILKVEEDNKLATSKLVIK